MLRNWLLPGLSGVFISLLLLHPALGQAEKVKGKPPATTTETAKPTPQATAPADNEQEARLLLMEGDEAHERKDYATAFEKYSASAELGNMDAVNMVGLMYDQGQFVEEDNQQALVWYRKAADAGHGIAMFNIGSVYLEETGSVDPDPQEAVAWFRRSAEAGAAVGMRYLGDSYFTGVGVDTDQAEAVAWYQKAVDAGDAEAYWRLALRYVYGQGVGKDTNRAAELAYEALVYGVETARDNLVEASKANLSSNFLKRIQQLLAEDGFYEGSIDGSFGPQTRTAIENAFNSETEALDALFGG